MNLVIDIGNTFAKVAVVEKGEIKEIFRYYDLTTDIIDDIIIRFPSIDKAILLSVRKDDEKVCEHIRKRMKYFLHLQHSTPLPITNLYSTPQTLGMDRIVAAVGAIEIFPNRDILLFDVGSAITIDFITSKGEFMGGNISPGVAMRFRALNQFTGKLPLCSIEDEISLIGKSTKEAIINGVINGIIYEIEGYISEYCRKNNNFITFFTGGDAKYFVYKLKNAIFADCDVLIKGLDKVLEYNYDKNEGV